MRSQAIVSIGASAVLMITAGIGAVLGIEAADDAPEVARLEASIAALESRVARTETERDRLRAERNRLEAQLATAEPPPVCPKPYISTAEIDLLSYYAIEYPCGWHLVHDARAGIDDDPGDGMLVTLTFLSQLPVSLAPREPPIADIELADWTDDPGEDGDLLPALQTWLDQERARFEVASETQFEAGDGITIHRFTGTQAVAEEGTAEVDVALWEFTDFLGARHVMRAVAVSPSGRARTALQRLARSFRTLRP